MRRSARGRRAIGGLLLAGFLLGAAPATFAAAPPDVQLSADLEGQPIKVSDVGRYHCHDLDYPRIQCFTTALELAAEPELALALLAGVTYVTIYEHTSYGGASMAIAEDYSIMAAIGWNDRVSSYRVRNFETGIFHVDWFGGGAADAFCCNQFVSSLGGMNDTFSSVYRT